VSTKVSFKIISPVRGKRKRPAQKSSADTN
jgi:hypothetical protein